jgi:hypothetical protein
VCPAAESIANSPEEWSRFWRSRADRPEREVGGVRRVDRSVAIIAAMAGGDEELVEEVVDRVLADLALRGRMFVGRRADAGDRPSVVIQTGEEGRYRLRLPDLMAPETVEGFMADAQEHLGEIFGEPVPHCPMHDHALLGKVTGAEIEWVCPEGAWRCALGEYEERTWPPGSDVPAGAVAGALVQRFERRGVTGWQRAGASVQDDVWVARVRVWPMDEALIDANRRAAAPVEVRIEPGGAPDPGAWQREMDRRLTENLAWADWAIRRWDTSQWTGCRARWCSSPRASAWMAGLTLRRPSSRSWTVRSLPPCRFPKRYSSRSLNAAPAARAPGPNRNRWYWSARADPRPSSQPIAAGASCPRGG